ncbi:MAG: hypothetical protein WAW07_01725 [Bacteroidales bacterium]
MVLDDGAEHPAETAVYPEDILKLIKDNDDLPVFFSKLADQTEYILERSQIA